MIMICNYFMLSRLLATGDFSPGHIFSVMLHEIDLKCTVYKQIKILQIPSARLLHFKELFLDSMLFLQLRRRRGENGALA